MYNLAETMQQLVYAYKGHYFATCGWFDLILPVLQFKKSLVCESGFHTKTFSCHLVYNM